MRRYLFVMLSLFTITAQGQAIFKCKQQDGTTAFQDSPCPGAPHAAPMAVVSPTDRATPIAHPYSGVPIPHQYDRMTMTAPHGSAGLNPQQARALIDQLMQAHQFSAAAAVATQNGQMGYFSEQEMQGPSVPPVPPRPQAAPQSQGGGLPPQQREQLKQELELVLTAMRSPSAKNSAAAPPGVSPDAHQLPWALVFVTNADGSFSPRGPVRYNGVSYSGPDAKFTHGVPFAGVDLTSVQGHGLWAHFEGRVLVIDKFE